MKKIIPVVAAVISNKSQILCVQRPKHKYEYISEKFEFPGGKIELGETEEDALKKAVMGRKTSLREELFHDLG